MCGCRQVPKLKQLQQSAAANGVPDLQLMSGAEAQALEPALSAVAALLSPSTGTVRQGHRSTQLLYCRRACMQGVDTVVGCCRAGMQIFDTIVAGCECLQLRLEIISSRGQRAFRACAALCWPC
jgi:hypothetical protein